MKSTASLVIALFLIGTGGGNAGAASLKSAVSVHADVIQLGDLFAEAGDKATTPVARSPAPGERLVLNAEQLNTLAKRGGLDWTTDNRFIRTVVTRRARVIGTEEIKAKVIEALRAEGLEKSWHIEFGKNDLTANVALDEDRPIRILKPRFSVHGKRFSSVLEVPRGSNGAERRQLTGKIYQVTEVPILAHRIQRGEIIRDRDLAYISMSREKIDRTALLDKRNIVGKEARRLLANGKPLRAGDLRPPVVVEKGSLVTLVLRTKHMLISARGKALDDGAAGETVRVLNTRSRETVEGIVEGRNRVAVAFAHHR